MTSVALLALAVSSGCTSSSPSQRPPSVASSVNSDAPSPATDTSASPTPTPTKTLSAFEHDPAVMALRSWAAEAARTVNSGRSDSARLDALMTKSFRKGIKQVLGGETRFRYPGPIPFTPATVTPTGPSDRDVHICVVSSGFSLNRTSGRPAHKRKVQAVDAGASQVGGTWLVSQFRSGSFSCRGVEITEEAF